MVEWDTPFSIYVSVGLIKSSKLFDSTFLVEYIKTPIYKREFLSKSLLTASPKKINMNNLATTLVKLPSLQEQKKLGEFFSLLEKKIKFQQERIDLLKEQKKGYMQKIFKQEIRFKDDNGKDYQEWIEISFDDLFESRNIKQIPTVDAPLMAFTSTGGVEEKGDRFNREFLVKNENKTYKRTEFNDLIYSSNNLDVGAIGRNKYGTAVISDVYEIFKVKNTTTPEFAEILIQQKNVLHKILEYRQGALYGQYRIHAIDFLSVIVKIPLIEEQEKIGAFFSKLDKKIQIEKEKLSALEEQKIAFMQKMFI